MKKLLLVTIMALGAGQAAAYINQDQVPKICPSWGCNSVEANTIIATQNNLKSQQAALSRRQSQLDKEQAKLARVAALKRKAAKDVGVRLGGGGCFTLDKEVECL